MKDKGIFIFGYSGHAYVIIDTLLSLQQPVIGYFDVARADKNPFGIKYIGFEKQVQLKELVGSNKVFPAVGDNVLRKKIVDLFETNALEQKIIIDPSALLSTTVTVGYSTFVGRMAVINAFTNIGNGCIINTGAVIEHECAFGNFVHIGPNATLAGNVSLGDGVFIGAGAVIKQGIFIGHGATVGAGSVVVKNIPDNEIWVGNPAKFLKYGK